MNKTRCPYNLFLLGRVVQSPAARALFKQHGLAPQHFVWRHVTGDWGEMEASEEWANYAAVKASLEVRSTYQSHGKTVLITTNPARTLTIIDLKQ